MENYLKELEKDILEDQRKIQEKAEKEAQKWEEFVATLSTNRRKEVQAEREALKAELKALGDQYRAKHRSANQSTKKGK